MPERRDDYNMGPGPREPRPGQARLVRTVLSKTSISTTLAHGDLPMELRELLIPYLFDPTCLAVISMVTILAGATLGSLVEYLFPPFWGDTLIVLGFLAAGEGTVPLWAAFLGALLGGTVGAWAAYLLGVRLGELPWLPRRFNRSERMDRVKGWVKRRGALALAVNRFLPGIRALFLPLAGAMRVPAGHAFWAALAGNLLWLLFLAGGALATEGFSGGTAAASAGVLVLLVLLASPRSPRPPSPRG